MGAVDRRDHIAAVGVRGMSHIYDTRGMLMYGPLMHQYYPMRLWGSVAPTTIPEGVIVGAVTRSFNGMAVPYNTFTTEWWHICAMAGARDFLTMRALTRMAGCPPAARLVALELERV